MTKIAEFIVKTVRESLGPDCDVSLQDLDDDAMCRMIFQNYRKNSLFARGIRLTPTGVNLLKDCFQSFSVGLSGDPLTVKDRLYLDRRLNFPYYLDGKEMVLFDMDFAVMLKLRDGKISAMREADDR